MRATIFGAIAASTAILVLAIALLADPLVTRVQTRHAEQELLATAHRAVGRIAAGDDDLDAIARGEAAKGVCHVRIMGADGRLHADSSRAIRHASAGEAPKPNAFEAKTRRKGTATTSTEVGGDITLHVAAVGPDGWLVRAARPMSSVLVAQRSVRELLLIGGALAVLLAALLAVALSRAIVRPVVELQRSADALAAGEQRVRVKHPGDDELGALGLAFNHMAEQLEERLQAAQSEEARLRAVLDGMAEAVVMTNRDAEIVISNSALDTLVGGSAQGKTVFKVTGSVSLANAVWEALRGRSSSVEWESELGGRKRSLVAWVAALPNEAGTVAVLHDITELRRADRIRRDFVANASHELRTPLTAIRGFVETLRDATTDDPAVRKRFLDTVLRHTRRLEALVDDLLLLSRAEAPGDDVELKQTSVSEVAQDVVRGLEARARERAIDLVVDMPIDLPKVAGNERALDQVLVNLVDNAIKYAPEATPVHVKGYAVEGDVLVDVHDSGPGIPPAHRERIFERFYRIDAGRSRDAGGTGLGLAIVKHLVLGMGGEVGVEGDAETGTTFRLRLKAATHTEPHPPEADAQPTNLG